MKNKFLQRLAILSAASTLGAAEPPATYTYSGQIAGVVCTACSSVVKTALEKLEGVQSVRITLDPKGGAPRIVITSTSPDITRTAAVKALGKAAADYQILSLNRQK
jgi:copper chaperone CopZ